MARKRTEQEIQDEIARRIDAIPYESPAYKRAMKAIRELEQML